MKYTRCPLGVQHDLAQAALRSFERLKALHYQTPSKEIEYSKIFVCKVLVSRNAFARCRHRVEVRG
jgi:hypothetical protein